MGRWGKCIWSIKWLNSLEKTSEVQQFEELSRAPSKEKHSMRANQRSTSERARNRIWLGIRIGTGTGMGNPARPIENENNLMQSKRQRANKVQLFMSKQQGNSNMVHAAARWLRWLLTRPTSNKKVAQTQTQTRFYRLQSPKTRARFRFGFRDPEPGISRQTSLLCKQFLPTAAWVWVWVYLCAANISLDMPESQGQLSASQEKRSWNFLRKIDTSVP